MKKLTLLVAGLMMFGFSYAHEGKACCKSKESCKKENTAKCEKGSAQAGEKKACCKSKSEGTAKAEVTATPVPAEVK